MRKITVKRRGKSRVVYSPKIGAERNAYRALAVMLRKVVAFPNVNAFGFGKSAMDMAMLHRGYKYTLSMDVSAFYDGVTSEKVDAACIQFGWTAAKHCIDTASIPLYPGGAARAGLPTSPILANIAFTPVDLDLQLLPQSFPDISVTRYVDDVIVSFNDISQRAPLAAAVEKAITKGGFTINHKKTKLQKAHAGRRMICGFAVDDDVHIPRRVKRRLRVKLHQHDAEGYYSLKQYCQMKPGLSTDPKEVLKHFFPEFTVENP